MSNRKPQVERLLDALTKIDNALRPLPPASQRRVLEAVAVLLKAVAVLLNVPVSVSKEDD